MSFGDSLRRVESTYAKRPKTIFDEWFNLLRESVIEGNGITGAPGQPVANEQGGKLRGSWEGTYTGPLTGKIATNTLYAEPNETGVSMTGGPYRLLARVGGRHLIKLTVAGSKKLVREAVKRVIAAGR